MPTTLPPKPDFSAIEASALESADRRTALLALIGNMICSWSNNESLFIYIIMLLMETDEISAAIVFSTLNTTRARLDLVGRLAKVKIADKQLRKELDEIIDRFGATTRMRNEFNHALYEMNAAGEITHTRSMKITEKRGRISFGESAPIDQERLGKIMQTLRDLQDLNRQLWDFLPRLQKHLAARTKR